MAKMKKTVATILLGALACLAGFFGVVFSAPQTQAVPAAQAATTYTTKDVAMMGSIAGWHGNGNFEIRLTLGEADWTNENAGQQSYKGTGDLPGLMKKLDLFNHIKVGGKTLAEWGCNSCYDNIYWLNESGPDYTLQIPLSMGKDNMTAATAEGVKSGSRLTILEGALIPSHAYLQGDTTATVYRAGCDFVTMNAGVAFDVMAIGKTDIESIKYVTGWDANYNNAYLGVSLKGDDYAADGTTQERHPDYYSDVYTVNHFSNKITADGVGSVAESYGLFNLNSKGAGYFSFVFRAAEEETESITIPAGTLFPSYAMKNLFALNATEGNTGNPVYIMYETQTDVTFYKQPDGSWAKPLVEKETTVKSAFVEGTSDNFTFIKLATHDYPTEIDNWNGGSVDIKAFLANTNFYSHVLVDGVALGGPVGEVLLNVWGNKGVIAFRTSKGSAATKITVLAGCQIPTYNALMNGAREVYVVSQEVSFVKNGNGEWVEYIPEGDFDTAITQVQFGRSTNIINFNLSVNDYPAPDGNNAATYNIGVDANKILELNFLDNIIVDGYTLRARYNEYGTGAIGSPWFWVNRFVGHNFAVRIPTDDGADIGAKKIVIRAGTQFPSMAYIKDGSQLFYVTTEEATYVRVSDDKEVSWEREAKIAFVADGKTVKTLSYTKTNGINGTLPDVPEKAGYKGVWESYTLNGEDIVVKAVYTAHDFDELETNVSKVQFEAGFLIVYLTNNDYSVGAGNGTLNAKTQVANMHFFDHVEVDGKRLSSTPTSSEDAYLNIWDNWGSFATYLVGEYRHYTPTQSIVLKKGCQIPSNAYRLDGSNKTCYVLTEDVVFLNENGVWVRQGDANISIKPEYEKDYVLSDLYNIGHAPSLELGKGYLYVDAATTGGSVYGYNVSESFSITFDFSLNLGNKGLNAQGNYTTFKIALATRGYNGGNAFGWSFYLYRPDNPNKCIEFINGGVGVGTWEEEGIFAKGQTYRVTLGYKIVDKATGMVQTYIRINDSEVIRTIELGADYYNTIGRYVDSISFSTNSAITNGVLVSDPGFKPQEDGRYNLTLKEGNTVIAQEKAWKYTLPALNAYDYKNHANDVFVGWTNDLNTLGVLYPAGYEMELTADTTMYPVWLNFTMRNGAAVRTTGASGLRFLVDVSGQGYQAGVDKNFIIGAGTLVVPTTYLDGGIAFVHESFPDGYFVDVPTETWLVEDGATWTYAAALVNISPAQYARSMSARGYLLIAYTDGTEQYVYTPYSKDLHARSIYDVATAAKKDDNDSLAVASYVNSIADVAIDSGFQVSNGNSASNNEIVCAKNGNVYTLTFASAVKAITVNGVRILAGYDAEVVIGNQAYTVSGYRLATDGKTATFTLNAGDTAAYYQAIVDYYKSSNEYSDLYKNEILSILEDWTNFEDNNVNAEMVAKLQSVKTETDERKNVGLTKLATPVVGYGAGYAVTWAAVANADYYFVTDSNDYRNGVIVTTNEYKPEVVGKHQITVTAYSYSKAYKSSDASTAFESVEIKPVYSYKAMSDGLYKFTGEMMQQLGIGDNLNQKDDGTSYYYDEDAKVPVYFAYYNKETGWSKDQGTATDWTSPAEFPAHAAKLKAMGNNVLLISEGTTASLGENSVWETSRTKYIMDTAWTLGMKVIVCDDVLYQQSKEVDSKSDAKAVIRERMALLEKYTAHPAFYGFSLEDEPEPNSLFTGSEMESVGFMVQALKETCATLGLSKSNGNEPFFLSCLYQYAEGFEIAGALVGYDDYLEDWFSGTGLDYVYVDLYTGHAMGDKTNRYKMTYDVVYKDGTNGILGGDKKFYQVITAHTQSKDYAGTLTEADLYMSMLYAAAHNVAGYSWFCYFPIVGETAASMVGFDGNGYGNGIGNNASGSYYNAAKTAGLQFELIQGVLNGYSLYSRSVSNNLLTTTLKKSGASDIKMYVNADTMSVSNPVSVNATGTCYLVGIGVGTEDAPYAVYQNGFSGSLAPGQAVICVG